MNNWILLNLVVIKLNLTKLNLIKSIPTLIPPYENLTKFSENPPPPMIPLRSVSM